MLLPLPAYPFSVALWSLMPHVYCNMRYLFEFSWATSFEWYLYTSNSTAQAMLLGRVTLWEYVPNRSGSAEPPTDLNVVP